MTTGKIEVARPSKSGKTLGVKIKGRWYSTNLWELQEMVGETITITDENTQTIPDGGSITYLNKYEVGATASAPRPGAPTVTTANPAENALLLEFVGRCMTGYNYQTTDEAMVRLRCRTMYNIGKDILSGQIAVVETAPRRPAHDEQPTPPPQDEFDDDIPF